MHYFFINICRSFPFGNFPLTGGPHKSGVPHSRTSAGGNLFLRCLLRPFWWKDGIHCDWPGFAIGILPEAAPAPPSLSYGESWLFRLSRILQRTEYWVLSTCLNYNRRFRRSQRNEQL